MKTSKISSRWFISCINFVLGKLPTMSYFVVQEENFLDPIWLNSARGSQRAPGQQTGLLLISLMS